MQRRHDRSPKVRLNAPASHGLRRCATASATRTSTSANETPAGVDARLRNLAQGGKNVPSRHGSACRLFHREILKKIGVILSPVGVVLSRLPQLAANIQVTIAIDIGDDRFMPAEL